MKNRNLKAVKTEDNSYTLFYEELNENYHSLDGAQSESEHVYIKNGLERLEKAKDELNILEIGFGSGLNAILTYVWAKKNKKKVNYWALEPFPIEKDLIDFLLENTALYQSNSDLFRKMHQTNDGGSFHFDDFFHFHFYKRKIEEVGVELIPDKFETVFFDAFAPSRQGEIWNIANLSKCYDFLKPGGILTTYCASGQFKRNLISAGFELIREKGFGKKREMFLGIKDSKSQVSTK